MNATASGMKDTGRTLNARNARNQQISGIKSGKPRKEPVITGPDAYFIVLAQHLGVGVRF